MILHEFATSIRIKLLAALSAALLLVIALLITAITIEFSMMHHAASLEAQHIADSISTSGFEDENHGTLQKSVEQIGRTLSRDVVVVDKEKRGIADADVTEVGDIFMHDPGNEVAMTIADGQVRIFEEKNDHHPAGIKQIVVPLREDAADVNSPIIGAVILEYTQLYESLLAQEKFTLVPMFATGAGSILLILVFGCRFAVNLARRLGNLELGVSSLARGEYQVKVPEFPVDEIGKLGTAVNKMAKDLQSSRNELLQHQQLLESRVAARTADLAEANRRLQAEMHEKELANERSEYLAYYDSLTALPNRRLFGKLLEQSLAQARRYKRSLAVLFVDLDRFKNINDTLGHDAGDLLLEEVAIRLKGCLRQSDTVARLGGDEFVILLPEATNEEDVAIVAHNILSSVSKQVSLLGQEFRITASIGISMYPSGGKDEQSLMKHADIAMYKAKEEGKNNFQFYSNDLNEHSFERLALETSLRLALERHEFSLHYQPKLAIGSNHITGMEALLRWQHPDLGMVPPVKFIPIAEEIGLIIPIGKWVLKTACLQNVAWQKSGLPPLCMAVNLSPRQFADENLLRDIAAILEEAGMEPALLELEITEGMLMHDIDKAMGTLFALKKMGVRLAIDDFGTGYSSLSQLKRFPVDTIKVDRSFIRDLETDADDRGITEAIIAMGKTLSLTVVAEGVETVAQLLFLRDHACDEFQGFYFSKAVPADEFGKLLRAQTVKGDSQGKEPRKRLRPDSSTSSMS